MTAALLISQAGDFPRLATFQLRFLFTIAISLLAYSLLDYGGCIWIFGGRFRGSNSLNPKGYYGFTRNRWCELAVQPDYQ
jgi:hypothetical protein